MNRRMAAVLVSPTEDKMALTSLQSNVVFRQGTVPEVCKFLLSQTAMRQLPDTDRHGLPQWAVSAPDEMRQLASLHLQHQPAGENGGTIAVQSTA